jgi:hypothetical protein
MKKVAPTVVLFVLGFIGAIAAVTFLFALIYNGIQSARMDRAQEKATQEGRELTPEELDVKFPKIEFF